MYVRYNPETERYEREGHKPVPKKDVLKYIPNKHDLEADLEDESGTGSTFERKARFILKVLSGDFLSDGEGGSEYARMNKELSFFKLMLSHEELSLFLGLLFILSETDPQFVEHHLEKGMLYAEQYSEEIIYPGHMFSGDTPGITFLRWFFMLRTQESRAVVDFSLGLINRMCRASFLHLYYVLRPMTTDYVVTKFCRHLFQHASITNPENYDKLVTLLDDKTSDKNESVNDRFDDGVSYQHKIEMSGFILDKCAQYLFDMTLFDRLVFLVKNE